MDYAIIQNGVVSNIIVGPLPDDLTISELGEFQIALGDRPVAIGDLFENGIFTRNGQPVLTLEEKYYELEKRIAELESKL